MNGNSSPLYPQYNGATNFQPRIGFSWQPERDHNMVVRGAYGISNFPQNAIGTGNLLFQNPPSQFNLTSPTRVVRWPSPPQHLIRDSPAFLLQVARSLRLSRSRPSAFLEQASMPSTTFAQPSLSSTAS